ncbi:MAG: hypothetical protein JO280_07385 [Mycobacteriaceae bacterium]|nr:hypothetical protein [Mycobacteriaceae bacterium]
MWRLENVSAIMAALLHDVLEDTDLTAADLAQAGISDEVVATDELLTRSAEMSDDEYYRRIAVHSDALEVKLALVVVVRLRSRMALGNHVIPGREHGGANTCRGRRDVGSVGLSWSSWGRGARGEVGSGPGCRGNADAHHHSADGRDEQSLLEGAGGAHGGVRFQ